MANEIYHRTNWGEAKPEGFGDMYFDPSATNKLYNRSTYYENSDATDKILKDIPNKASIVLTPTGYSEDSINTAIPPYQVLPTNIVTNGTFDTDSDWTKETGWTISNGKANFNASLSTAGYIIQTNILELGKKYKLNATVDEGVVSLISAFYDVQQGENIQTGTSSIFTVTNGTDLRLYSHPSNGNASITDITVQEIQEADFTFARNSSATRVNQAGLIEDVNSGTNLVTNGTFDTDSDWTKGTGWTIGNGVASNVGSASYLTSTASFRWEIGKKYRVSLEVTAYSSGQISLPFDATGANLNYENSIGVKSTIIVAGATNPIYIYSNGFDGSIDNVSVIQLDEATDTPRLDYTTGQGAFLLEPQSTNLLLYSQNFTEGVWNNESGNQVVNTNVETSPSGTLTASKLTVSSGGVTTRKLWYYFSTTIGLDYTYSVYIKAVDGQVNTGFISLATLDTHINQTFFTATDVWQRVVVTGTANNAVTRALITGDANCQIFIWGAQLEQQSYATSYIPTVGSTVTRSAESANSSGNSDLFNDSEGVLYTEISALADDGTFRMLSISDGTTNNRVRINYTSSTEQLQGRFIVGGVTQAVFNKSSTGVTTFHKAALQYKANEVKFFVDGNQIGSTDTSASVPSADTFDTFNFDGGSGSSEFYGKAKGVAVFKEALTDIELEKLTSWRDFRDLAESQQYTLVTIKSDAIVVSAYGTTSGGGGVSGGGSGGGGGY